MSQALPANAAASEPPASSRGDALGARPRTTANVVLRVVATLVAFLLVALAVRKIGFASLRGALTSAAMTQVAIGALFSLSMQAAKAAYWRAILAPVARVPFFRMLWYGLSASGASVVLPLRGGEALRMYALRRDHGVPLATSAVALAFEKVADVGSLVLLALPVPWLFPDLPWGRAFKVLVLLVLVALPLAIVVARRQPATGSWLARFRIFGGTRAPLVAAGWVLVSWVADVALILAVMSALGLPLYVAWALLVLVGANVAIAIPAAPGNVGTLELGVGVALAAAGVADERAAAFAVLYHGVQLVTLVGAWCVGAVVALVVGERAQRALT